MKEQTVNGNLAQGIEVLEGCDKEPELCSGSPHQSASLFQPHVYDSLQVQTRDGLRENEILDST